MAAVELRSRAAVDHEIMDYPKLKLSSKSLQ